MPHASSAAGPATGLAFAVAIVGGVFVALSMPPWGFWPLAFVGAACLEYAVRTTDSRRRRAWLGFAFGAPWMFIGMAWMWFLTAPGYVVAALLLAALHGGAAAVGPTGRFGVIGRPAAHTLAEIVRISVPFGGIPLATMGIALSGGPFLQLARVGGVVLLTWFVFQIGSTLGGPLVRGEWPAMHPREPTVLVALVAVALVAVALVAPEGSDRAFDPVTVAAVQGGGEQGTSALDVPSSRVTEAHLAATATIDPDDALDLVVWPENGIDVNDQPFEGSVAYELVAAEAARLGVPLSVGVTVDSEFSADPVDGGFVNAQVLVYPDGHIGDSYEKVRIVPFGEYVPLRAPLEALGAPLEQIPSDAIRGRDGAVVTVEDGEPPLTLGVLISWEVFFGDRSRAAGEADILINSTNGASYTGTIVQSQQVASSKLRAAETGRWVVQVSPTGFSAFVSPAGGVFQRTDVSERAVITKEVPRRTGTTWYQTLGDLPWIALVAAVFLLTHTHQRLHVRVVSDTSRTAAGSGLEQQGDGAVVDDRDVHLGAEPAGRDDRAVPT